MKKRQNKKKKKEELTLDYFKKFISDNENLFDTDFNRASEKLREFKAKYPFVDKEEPYKTLWWQMVKKWQVYLKKASEPTELPTTKGRDHLPFEYFKTFIKSMDQLLNTDPQEVTKKLKEFKEKYPFINKEDPYQKLWWETIKKWNNIVNK